MTAAPVATASRTGASATPGIAPGARAKAQNQHEISLLVSNKPGVLVRISLVFSRRGYNIESLVVSPAAREGFSRMTITCSGDPATLQQIIKQLTKLVDVVRAIDHTADATYQTEIALLKVEPESADRTEVLQIAEHFNARVVDYSPESLILRIYGDSDKLDAAVDILSPFRITELVRSGKIVMARGRATT